MSVGSIVVVVLLFALVGFALWRNFKKGAPCSCGGSRKECACGASCRDRSLKRSAENPAALRRRGRCGIIHLI